MIGKHILAAGAATALLLAAMPAAAATIVAGNNPQTDENILIVDQTGNPITGTGNSTGFVLNILGGETLVGKGGQASVDSSDDSFTTLTFSLADPTKGFRSLILNIDALDDGTVTFTTLGDAANLVLDLDKNGNNFFTLTADTGEFFTSVSFTSSVAVADVKQIRVGGVGALDGSDGETAVPEPATWALMIMGFGGAGAMLRRRRTALV